MENKTENKTITRAEKKDATKNLIKEVLAQKSYKHNDLIDEVASKYIERFGGQEADKINDVKGRVGSVLDVMKKESDVGVADGEYRLKARTAIPPETKKTEEEKDVKPARKTRAKKTKNDPLPPAPLQPIAPVDPVSPETAPKPAEEKPVKRKRAKKTDDVETEEQEQATATKTAKPQTDEKPKKTVKRTAKKAVDKDKDKEKKEEKQDGPTLIPENEPVIVPTPIPAPVSDPTPAPSPVKEPVSVPTSKEKTPTAPPAPVFDLTAIFGQLKTPAKEEKPLAKKDEDKAEARAKEDPQNTKKERDRVALKEKIAPAPVATPVNKEPNAPATKQKTAERRQGNKSAQARPVKTLSADEGLKESFLKKLRSLSGEYFEYYSVYLLEKYSRMNGRRLEGLRVSGGDQDGGIDGEIELTDKLGFRETIYIQAKNWNPAKGKEHLWVVGETLLQQFIGACVCRQAKEGKQNWRGMFITTSRFTPEAKRLLNEMSDRLVGYDENDLFEAAKECSFGLLEKNGVWTLDEKLLSGEKAFFAMV